METVKNPGTTAGIPPVALTGTERTKVIVALLVLSLPGVTATAFLADMLADSAMAEPPPAAALIAAGLVQVAITIIIGAFAAPAVGFGAPAVTAFVRRQDWAAALGRQLKPGVLAGIAAGLAIVVLDTAIFAPRVPPALMEGQDLPLYADLISRLFYGGIVEELLMRWGLMSLIVWLLHFIISKVKGASTAAGVPGAAAGHPRLHGPGPGIVWAGIIISALLFGLGHLPVTTALVGTLTPAIVLRALLLNGLGGIAFGWLYARHGLESAMIAHGAAHLSMMASSAFI